MDELNGTFRYTYTAQKKSYLLRVAFMQICLIIVVSICFNLVSAFEAHSFRALFNLSIFPPFPTLFILSLFLTPLLTKHELNWMNLHVCYGLFFRADIPLTSIVSAEPVHEKLNLFFPLPSYQKKIDRLDIAFSEQGQILLHLDEPHSFYVGRQHVYADKVLMNVDSRDEFLQTLQYLRESALER